MSVFVKTVKKIVINIYIYISHIKKVDIKTINKI